MITIILAALLALVSTANAGILTASRYPLALSRDDLFLKKFEYIHPRFNTPSVAILTTGAVIVFIVATQKSTRSRRWPARSRFSSTSSSVAR